MKLFLAITLSAALAIYSQAQTGENLPRFPGGILMAGTTPVAGTSEIQTLTIGGTPTAGTFTITFEGQTTAAITWTAVDATLVSAIDAALEALTNIGTGGVTVTDTTLTSGIGDVTITFTGNRAKQNVPLAVANSSLTGTAPTAVIATTTAGVDADGRISPKGQLLIEITNGKVYINTGTPPNPTWTLVGSQT